MEELEMPFLWEIVPKKGYKFETIWKDIIHSTIEDLKKLDEIEPIKSQKFVTRVILFKTCMRFIGGIKYPFLRNVIRKDEVEFLLFHGCMDFYNFILHLLREKPPNGIGTKTRDPVYENHLLLHQKLIKDLFKLEKKYNDYAFPKSIQISFNKGFVYLTESYINLSTYISEGQSLKKSIRPSLYFFYLLSGRKTPHIIVDAIFADLKSNGFLPQNSKRDLFKVFTDKFISESKEKSFWSQYFI